MRWLTRLLVFLAIGFLPLAGASAQLPLSSQQQQQQDPGPADPFGRETPRSSLAGLIRALAEQDYALAGRYFTNETDDPALAAEMARALQASLDAGGDLAPFVELSNDPLGKLQDQLPADQERVGVLGGPGEVPILLTRTTPELAASEGSATAPSQPPIWQISRETIAALEERLSELPAAGEEEDKTLVAGAPVVDWGILLGLLFGAFALFWLLSSLILQILRRVSPGAQENSFYQFLYAALPPFSLLLAVFAFRSWGSEIEVSIVARQLLLRYVGIVAWIALAWFAIRLVDAVARKLTGKLDARERRQAAAAVTLARRGTKLLLVAIAAIAILDTLGVQITTGLAALGIGGLALALGAQKTIENLVGSVTVVADRPIQVGDFCQVGDVLGTVEDIGIRSTRIRTLARTIVTIPNGDFSSRQIENYSKRDRFLFNPVVGFQYGLQAAKLREGVAIIEEILADRAQIAAEPRRAKLANFGASSLEVEVFAYIEAGDYDESVNIRHDLLTTIFERLEEAGLSIAIPARAVYLNPADDAPSPKP